MFICQLCGCSSENHEVFEILQSASIQEDGSGDFMEAEGWIYCTECVEKIHNILAILEHK